MDSVMINTPQHANEEVGETAKQRIAHAITHACAPQAHAFSPGVLWAKGFLCVEYTLA